MTPLCHKFFVSCFCPPRPMYVDSTGDKHSDSQQPVAKLLRTYLEPLLHVSLRILCWSIYYTIGNVGVKAVTKTGALLFSPSLVNFSPYGASGAGVPIYFSSVLAEIKMAPFARSVWFSRMRRWPPLCPNIFQRYWTELAFPYFQPSAVIFPVHQEYKVDLALWGHHHLYHRSCPVYQEVCLDQGTVHVLVAMGGHDLSDNVE